MANPRTGAVLSKNTCTFTLSWQRTKWSKSESSEGQFTKASVVSAPILVINPESVFFTFPNLLKLSHKRHYNTHHRFSGDYAASSQVQPHTLCRPTVSATISFLVIMLSPVQSASSLIIRSPVQSSLISSMGFTNFSSLLLGLYSDLTFSATISLLVIMWYCMRACVLQTLRIRKNLRTKCFNTFQILLVKIDDILRRFYQTI